MVENLLSVTKISGNETNLKKQEEIVEEVVSEAVTRTQKRFPDHRTNRVSEMGQCLSHGRIW